MRSWFAARWAYTPSEGRQGVELALSLGQRVQVLHQCPSGWWTAVSPDSGRRGLVPGNYLAPVPADAAGGKGEGGKGDGETTRDGDAIDSDDGEEEDEGEEGSDEEEDGQGWQDEEYFTSYSHNFQIHMEMLQDTRRT